MHQLRPMRPDDIPALGRLQAECYSSLLQEDEATMLARLQLAPDSAWVAEDESGVCAYLVCYRSALGKITPLNGVFDIVRNGDALYLHDLAVSPRCSGRGIGTALARLALQTAAAQGLAYAALVSVQGSQGYWQRLGFTVWDGLEPGQAAQLSTYPVPAVYMVRACGAPPHAKTPDGVPRQPGAYPLRFDP